MNDDNEPTVVAPSLLTPVVICSNGRLIPPLELREEHVSLGTVARALAYRQRWAGCTPHFYSVGQHCLAGAKVFSARGRQDLALAFLCHDLGEVFLPDLPAPLKPLVRINGEPWEVVERDHLRTILSALNAPWDLAQLIQGREVRHLDAALALRERDVLMPNCEKPWALDFRAEPAEGVEVRIDVPVEEAAREWARTFIILKDEVST